MRKVKLRDRKKVRLRNRPPKRVVPDRPRQVGGNLAPVVSPMPERKKQPKTYQEFVAQDPPPDLAALVKTYGTFMQIPPQAWVQWDKEYRAWQARVRSRHWAY